MTRRLKVYLEGAIPGNYTARPTADAIKSANQAEAFRWHERFLQIIWLTR